MHTIAPHLAVATVLAAQHLRPVRPLAAAKAAGQLAGGVIVLALVVVVAALASIASAARGLAALLSEFLRLAAAVTSAVFLMGMAVVVALALLLHH
jgi:hypothetical protein